MALELFLFPVEPREGMNPQLSNAGSGQGCRTHPCRRRAAFAPGSALQGAPFLVSFSTIHHWICFVPTLHGSCSFWGALTPPFPG